MRKILTLLLLLSIRVAAQTGQVNHGGTGLNASANDSILVGTGPNTYTLVNVPDCQDVNGNHLNYNGSTYTVTCGTSSTSGSGTPFQVTRYDSSGHVIQDSTGNDNPANGPTRWTNGLSVESNAGYRAFANSSLGTAVNLLACADLTATTITQITTCTAGSSKAFGIVDNGAGVSGNARVAMIGFHACIFDNQTTVNDYVAPSATTDGQCTDVGASKPNNVQILGKVTTANSGVATLATVDLFTGDTVAPGASGGGGTVSSSCNGVAYYPSTGTTIVGDCLFITDGSGHVTMYSLGLLDSTYAGFLYQKQGPLPPAAPTNTIEEFAPTSVTTYSIQKAAAAGTTGQCWTVLSTSTDANAHTIDNMGWGSCSGGGGGSGTVTSVGQTVNSGSSSGIFAVTGSPVTTSGTLNINTAGTSGGVPYFSSGTIVSSSGALAAHGVVLGQGAGAAPVTTGTGTLGFVLTSNGPSADPTYQAVPSSGGGGASKIPFDSCGPSQAYNLGNAYWRSITYTTATNISNSQTGIDIGQWEYAVNTDGDVNCKLEIPSNASGTMQVLLDLAAADGTAGHTAAFKVCYAVSSSQDLQGLTYTCTATQNYVSTASAYVNTRLTFNVATATVGEYLLVDIHQNSGGTNVNPVRMTAKVKVF